MYLNKYILIVLFINCISAGRDSTIIQFFIEDNQNELTCRSLPTEGHIQDRGSFKIVATAKETLRTSKCFLRRDNSNSHLTTLNVKETEPLRNVLESRRLRFSSEAMNGKALVCSVTVDRLFETNGSLCDQRPCVECVLPLNITSNVAEGRARKNEHADKENIIIIGSAVGAIVLLIIVGQTIALLYFRRRAREQDIMESLRRNQKPFNRNDKVRYSAPPTRNTKTNKEEADRDSHIYEMVVVNAKDTGSDTTSILDIRDRPPLPLPGEAYDEPLEGIETLPRRSPKVPQSVSDSSRLAPRTVKKEPPPVKPKISKPPKKVDENSLPGSLRRPTKPVPKAGSISKTMVANDPSLIELKNVLKMRKMEASAAPSPVSTLERKPQPITPKKIPPPETATLDRNPPVGVIKPLSSSDHLKPSIHPLVAKTNLTSTMKAKLETINLKKPYVTETPIQPTRLPFPNASNRHIPVTNATHIPHAPPVSMSPGSLMVPVTSMSTGSLLPPVQVKGKGSCRPLPPEPLEQEDANQDDDDEWTYEALDSYNIYNV